MNHRALAAALAGVCLAAATRAQLPATAERSGPAAPERAALNVWLDDGGLGGRTRVALTAAVPAGATMADVEVAKNRVTAAHAAALSAEVVGPFAEAALAAGFEIRALGALAPWVALEGPEDPLRTWLAGRREVLVVEAEQFEGGPELDDSVPTVKADWVRTHPTLPMNGAGVKVGVLDSGGVLQANPYLPAGILFNGSPGAQAHSTACAGMVASNHATHTGVAPGVTLLSTGTSSGNSAYLTNGEWCYLNGADLVTCSLFVGSTTTNGLNLSDRGFDYLVRNLGRTFVKSCGNQGNGGYVTSPGRGFNSVAVGNVNDGGTPDWADDVMASSSSGLDPSTGAPKPEVSAPGTSITSTTLSSPWTANVGSGTSYAAPHVAGAAALLMEQAPVLKTRPEAIKALLIATAWHNIEGDRLLSELDGAGAIDCAAAYRTVEAGRFAHGLLTAADFVGGVKDFTFPLKAGNLTRVALSWCSDPADATASYTPDALDATFDVTVHATAGGPALAVATHPSAAWRILQFTPATSGPYVVRVHQTQWLGTSEPFGLAVSQKYDGDVNRIAGAGPASIGTSLPLTLKDPYHPGAGWLLGLGVSGGDYGLGVALTEQTLPLIPDVLTLAVFQPGSAGLVTAVAGVLNGFGEATTTLLIPAQPVLVGFEISMVFVSTSPTALDGVVGVSPRYVSTVVN